MGQHPDWQCKDIIEVRVEVNQIKTDISEINTEIKNMRAENRSWNRALWILLISVAVSSIVNIILNYVKG